MTRPVSELLEELDSLIERASARPWRLELKEDPDEYSGLYSVFASGEDVWSLFDDTKYYPSAPERKEDAALIVALVNAFPALKEEIERLTNALDQIAHGEIAERGNGKTFLCQMSGRGMQRLARRTLKGDEDNGT